MPKAPAPTTSTEALLHYVKPGTPVYYIDPRPAAVPAGVNVIPLKASEGVARLAQMLKK